METFGRAAGDWRGREGSIEKCRVHQKSVKIENDKKEMVYMLDNVVPGGRRVKAKKSLCY